MVAERMRPHLVQALGVMGLLVLSACSTSQPYGARYDDAGYTYSHRRHGLYNDSSYRMQRWRDDDDGYRDRYRAAPPGGYTYYDYDDDGYRRFYRAPTYRYDDDTRYGYGRVPIYYEDDYRWYGYRSPSDRYDDADWRNRRRD